jgi:hypothetical protein
VGYKVTTLSGQSSPITLEGWQVAQAVKVNLAPHSDSLTDDRRPTLALVNRPGGEGILSLPFGHRALCLPFIEAKVGPSKNPHATQDRTFYPLAGVSY